MRSKKFVGKEYLHPDLGRVFVESAINRVKVEITCLQRAKGWNDAKECYQRYKEPTPILNTHYSGHIIRWNINRESNDQYGHKDLCHIDKLIAI
tara:strand:- start:12353 stop:12634 length:282 start_codon:yes stop_codon:yes gene_type:complete